MSGAKIQIRGLHRTFHKGGKAIHVLTDVSLDIASGETVAVVGPSGSGKSTFLQILGTLDRPTQGVVSMNDIDIFKQRQTHIDRLRNRHIGFVFQFHHLLPDQTALDNVALPMIIQGIKPSDAREVAAARLSRVGLDHRLTHRPGELSGGEQQRVAIARALVMDPGLLLADEPTGNLDPATADGVFELLIELNREVGSTLVVVTHSMELARRFPRILRVVDGSLIEERGAAA
jgi:lipoprotein-releasing system ATP-binding protein